MYEKVAVINYQEHKDMASKAISDVSFAKSFNACLIGLDEYFEAAKDYALLFSKDVNGNWFAQALLGIKEGENLFITKEGFWEQKRYIPAFIRRYPFIFATLENSTLAFAIDESYLEPTNKTNSERTLFKTETELSDYAKGVMDFMNNYQAGLERSRALITDLENLGLLEEKSASFVSSDTKESFGLNGFFTINEEKLNHLSENKRLELCKKGMIPFITAHLMSLSNINKLG